MVLVVLDGVPDDPVGVLRVGEGALELLPVTALDQELVPVQARDIYEALELVDAKLQDPGSCFCGSGLR